MNDLFSCIELASDYLINNKSINNDIINKISLIVSDGGYVGISQINPIAGNFEYNSKKIANYIRFANKIGLDAVFFPKLALSGYDMENIIKKHPILYRENIKWLDGLAKITNHTKVFICFSNVNEEGKYSHSLAVLQNRNIKNIYNGTINICDDYLILTDNDVNNAEKYLNEHNCKLIINCSEVTFDKHKKLFNNDTFSKLSSKYKTPIIHVNQVGLNDNIIYEGISSVYNSSGKLISRAKAFEEQFLIVNPNLGIGKIYPLPINYEEAIKEKKEFSLDYNNDMDRTYRTLILGIKDYFSKCGLKRAVLGLSGGLDSTVCAVLLTDAIGKENVLGVSMPSYITSKESKTDAEQLAHNLGINYIEVPIRSMIDTTSENFNRMFKQIEANWNNRYKESFTSDNIQARSRAMILFGISNEFPNCIPIATSDKSEAYMGYATINGDMSGGFAPIADITKTKLFALAKWLNKNRINKNCIPENIIQKRPGAELAINPKTGKALIAEDALMPYEFLDEIIWRIENNHESFNDMMISEFVYEKNNDVSKEQKIEWLNKFYKRMSSALFKWSIMPPSIVAEEHSINSTIYHQPVTSCRINYKGVDENYINENLGLN